MGTESITLGGEWSWPPVVASNQRVRGLYPECVSNPTQCEEFLDEFNTAQQAIPSNPLADRISVRLVGDSASIRQIDESGIKIEGALPVSDHPDTYLAYAAWNDCGRKMSDESLAAHRQTIDNATQKPVTEAGSDDGLAEDGYKANFLDQTTSKSQRKLVLPQFSDLAAVFGYDEADLEEMITTETNVVAFVTNQDDEVISVAIGERSSVAVEGFPTIITTEITDAFTQPALRGKGLYRTVSRLLTQQVVDNRAEVPVDVLFGESNLTMPGVINASWVNGRRFNHHDGSLFGIERPDFGILEQNFRVFDGIETRPYNDFALTYIPL